MSFTLEECKNRKVIDPGLPLVFIDSVHFLNNSYDSLVKNLDEKDFYLLSQEFDADVLHFVCITTLTTN